MSIPTNQCSTTILIWVDTNALQNGSTKGVYVVDNRLNWGSSKEGTPNLSTNVTNGTNICWKILNVDLNSNAQLSIQEVGNSSAWGASGQPQSVDPTTFTGQAQVTGQASYQLIFNAQNAGGSGITTTLNLQINVQ
jgi:hypothetical protein